MPLRFRWQENRKDASFEGWTGVHDLMAGGRTVVELRAVEKLFENGTRALAPVDLMVADGEFLTLIGPSGCGKSTVLRLIADLVMPSAGSRRWWGGDFSEVGREGRRLAFVFQDPTLMPWANVAKNVRLPLDLEHVPKSEAKPRVAAALERVGLADAGDALPRQLSGGMRMRVSIARALVTDPNLLLMDEPFGALDEFSRHNLDVDLVRLATERKLTTVFVTHSIYEAVFVSTRVVVMGARPGRIMESLDVDEPMPRDPGFRDTTRFLDLCRQLSSRLADASVRAGR